MTYWPKRQALPHYGATAHPSRVYCHVPITLPKRRPLSAAQVAGRALGVGFALGAVVLALMVACA